MGVSTKVNLLADWFIHSFIHSIQQALIWYMPGVMQGAGYIRLSDIDAVSVQSLNRE